MTRPAHGRASGTAGGCARRATARAGASPSPRPWLLLAALVVVVATACVEPPSAPLPAPALPQAPEVELPEVAARSLERQVLDVTVRVRSLGCDRFGLGSGFLLPDGVVVTNRHVIEQPREVTINTWDGRSLPVTVTGVATDSDLALLQLGADTDLPVAALRSEPLATGEDVLVVGYPGGGPAEVTEGRMLGVVDGTVLGEPAEVLRIEAEVAQGSSGGPVFDLEGRVVGVIFAIEVDADVALAVPVATLLDRLDAGALSVPDAC